MKKVIYFCRGGRAISDFEISNEVDWLISTDGWDPLYEKHIYNGMSHINKLLDKWDDNSLYFFYSTHLVIDELRVRIKQGEINKDDYEFWIEDSKGTFNNKVFDTDGRSSKWFDSEKVMEDILLRLLD